MSDSIRDRIIFLEREIKKLKCLINKIPSEGGGEEVKLGFGLYKDSNGIISLGERDNGNSDVYFEDVDALKFHNGDTSFEIAKNKIIQQVYGNLGTEDMTISFIRTDDIRTSVSFEDLNSVSVLYLQKDIIQLQNRIHGGEFTTISIGKDYITLDVDPDNFLAGELPTNMKLTKDGIFVNKNIKYGIIYLLGDYSDDDLIPKVSIAQMITQSENSMKTFMEENYVKKI